MLARNCWSVIVHIISFLKLSLYTYRPSFPSLIVKSADVRFNPYMLNTVRVCIGRFEYSGPAFSRDYLSAKKYEKERTFRILTRRYCVHAEFCVEINVEENALFVSLYANLCVENKNICARDLFGRWEKKEEGGERSICESQVSTWASSSFSIDIHAAHL